MLDGSRAPRLIDGLTVFADHADPDLHYVLAERPQVVANPDPRLSLLLFRGEESGAFLQMEVTLAPTQAALEAASRTLAASGRTPILARPDWRHGTVRLVGWLQAEALAPMLITRGVPSLVGDPSAVFAARLDVAGASLAAAALRGDALPTAVIFELDTLGLAGPLNVKVEARLRAIHDRLSAEGALSTPYGRARLAATWESALRDNLIRVEILDESGDVESQRAEAMRRVGEDLVARMFSPMPPPELPSRLEGGQVAPIELSFQLTDRREELATSSTWDFRERRPRAIRHYAAANLIDLLAGRPATDVISLIDLSASESDMEVRIAGDPVRHRVTSVEVDVRWSEDGIIDRTVTVTPDQPVARFPRRGRRWWYRTRVHLDPAFTRTTVRESAWATSESSLLMAELGSLAPVRRVTLLFGRAEPEWIDHVEVTLTTAGEASRSVRLTGAAPVAEIDLPGGPDAVVTATADWHGRDGEPSASSPPQTVEGDLFLVDSPFAPSIGVTLVPLPAPDLSSRTTEVRVRHGDYVHGRTVTWELPSREPQRVVLRRLNGMPDSYEFRTQSVGTDGRLVDEPWRSSTTRSLIVGARGPDDEVRSAELVILGGVAARQAVAAEVTFEADDARATDVLEGSRDEVTLVLVAPRQASSTLTVREFLTSGDVRETTWTNPPAITVMAPDATP